MMGFGVGWDWGKDLDGGMEGIGIGFGGVWSWGRDGIGFGFGWCLDGVEDWG